MDKWVSIIIAGGLLISSLYFIGTALGQVNQTLIEEIERQEQRKIEQPVNQALVQELEKKIDNNTSVLNQLGCSSESSTAVQNECVKIMQNNQQLMENITNARLGINTAMEDPNVKTIIIVRGAHNEDNGQYYNPSTIIVKPGTKVIWKNEDYPDQTDPYASDTIKHTATSGSVSEALPDGWFMTDLLDSGESNKPIEMPSTEGVYPYFCIMHPNWMNGTVVVKR